MVSAADYGRRRIEQSETFGPNVGDKIGPAINNFLNTLNKIWQNSKNTLVTLPPSFVASVIVFKIFRKIHKIFCD
jgi:hypothetical protein